MTDPSCSDGATRRGIPCRTSLRRPRGLPLVRRIPPFGNPTLLAGLCHRGADARGFLSLRRAWPSGRTPTPGSPGPDTSSATSSVVSPFGTITCPDRTTATMVASRGMCSSASGSDPHGNPSARRTSTSFASLPCNGRSCTRDPTDTASSTSAVSRCGLDTDTSTPQVSLKSHWFFGWFTRATTRGIANSCLARRAITRLTWSSPVAATMTSTSSRPAEWSSLSSQASASMTSTPSASRIRSAARASRSITTTSWSERLRSPAM